MINTNLKYLWKKFKYTQEDIANKIGVSRQAVAKWENGETLPDINNCLALSKLYGVTLDDLVNYDMDCTRKGSIINKNLFKKRDLAIDNGFGWKVQHKNSQCKSHLF